MQFLEEWRILSRDCLQAWQKRAQCTIFKGNGKCGGIRKYDGEDIALVAYRIGVGSQLMATSMPGHACLTSPTLGALQNDWIAIEAGISRTIILNSGRLPCDPVVCTGVVQWPSLDIKSDSHEDAASIYIKLWSFRHVLFRCSTIILTCGNRLGKLYPVPPLHWSDV